MQLIDSGTGPLPVLCAPGHGRCCEQGNLGCTKLLAFCGRESSPQASSVGPKRLWSVSGKTLATDQSAAADVSLHLNRRTRLQWTTAKARLVDQQMCTKITARKRSSSG